MKTWELHEAEAAFNTLLKEARHTPQLVSRHGVEEAVVMDIKQYKALVKYPNGVASFFKNSPLYGLDLTFERDQSIGRSVAL